eukprot:362153-Prymnesium_polylepis.2
MRTHSGVSGSGGWSVRRASTHIGRRVAAHAQACVVVHKHTDTQLGLRARVRTCAVRCVSIFESSSGEIAEAPLEFPTPPAPGVNCEALPSKRRR